VTWLPSGNKAFTTTTC